MLEIQSSFQDTPGDDFYFVLYYDGQPLCEQLEKLGLVEGSRVILYDEDCGDLRMEATLLVDYKHSMMFKKALWAKADTEYYVDPKAPVVPS